MAVCSICGKTFVGVRATQRVCYDRECKLEHKRRYNSKRNKQIAKQKLIYRDEDDYLYEGRAKHPPKTRTCLRCNKEFTTTTGDRICSRCHTINRLIFSGGCIDDVY